MLLHQVALGNDGARAYRRYLFRQLFDTKSMLLRKQLDFEGGGGGGLGRRARAADAGKCCGHGCACGEGRWKREFADKMQRLVLDVDENKR